MAQKRMFDKAIIDTDRFMDMPMSTKALYFLLGMESDDEGFVSYKKVVKIHGGTDDDTKLLIAKGFVIHFDSGVVVITDWQKNNWLDSRRLKPTEYQKERKMLNVVDGKYVLNNRLASAKPEECSIEECRGVEIAAPASQDAEGLGDGSFIELDEESVPTAVLGRSEGIKKLGYDPSWVNQLVKWAEDRMGHEFTAKVKQKSAIKKMLSTKYTVAEIQKEWDRLSMDTYWASKGFDFSIVSNEIGKMKSVFINKGPGVTVIRP